MNNISAYQQVVWPQFEIFSEEFPLCVEMRNLCNHKDPYFPPIRKDINICNQHFGIITYLRSSYIHFPVILFHIEAHAQCLIFRNTLTCIEWKHLEPDKTLLWAVSWIFMYISMVKNIPLSLYKPVMQRKASSCCKHVRIILIKICCGGELAHGLCTALMWRYLLSTTCTSYTSTRASGFCGIHINVWVICRNWLAMTRLWISKNGLVANRHPYYSVLWSSLSGPLDHRSVLKGLWAAGKIPC